MQQSQRVVVTGLGAITSLGMGAKNSWKAVLQGKSGITNTNFTYPYMCKVGAPLPHDFDEKAHQTSLGESLLFSGANAIVNEALQDAGINTKDMAINRDRFAIHCSTQYGNLAHFQKALQNHEIKERIKSTSIMVSAILSMQHQVFGDLENGPTTCTGALTVLGNAYRQVKHGYLDVCVAGGFDTVLDSPGHKIMDTYGLKKARDGSIQNNDSDPLHPERSLRSFDQERKGAVFGDGGAMLVVESLESALRRGAKIYFEIGGYSANNEAYHLSSPTPEGYGLVKAMKGCLNESGIRNDQIDLINPHGSGTRIGDISESRAIKMILGTPHDKLMKSSLSDIYAQKDDDFDKKNLKRAVIVAHKAYTGHTGVVQGAIECALVAKSFEDNIAPKILNLENPVEPLLNFAMKENVKKEIDVAVKTGYGMGGSCAALLFKRYKD